MAKTIFITSFHTLISRNILQTRLLSLLKDKNIRAVILAPDYKKDYFVKNFGGERVIVEGVNTELTRLDLLFRRLAIAVLPTRTSYIKKRSKFYQDRKFAPFVFSLMSAYFFGHFRFCLRFLRFFDRLAFKGPEVFTPLILKYKPDLIFAADVQMEMDTRLLHEARRMGIRTTGMVRSWDNLSAKGIIRILPDHLMVHNQIMKQELMDYDGVSADKISIVGIPHYDNYFNFRRKPLFSREVFFAKFGFDVTKPLILVAPAGDRYIRNNQTDKRVIELLSELDANILIRIPPGDAVNLENFASKKAKIVFDYTGFSAWKGGRKLNEMTRKDDERLMNSFYWCNVVVSHLASMCIDAAFFDKPTVVFGFDAIEDTAAAPKIRPYWDSIRRYFDYEHLQPIIRSGGVKIAWREEQFLPFVKEYLNNPDLDKKGREKIVQEQAGFSGGKATEHLAEILSSFSL